MTMTVRHSEDEWAKLLEIAGSITLLVDSDFEICTEIKFGSEGCRINMWLPVTLLYPAAAGIFGDVR